MIWTSSGWLWIGLRVGITELKPEAAKMIISV